MAKRKVEWTNRSLDQIHQDIEDYVYQEAMNGTKLSWLAREFGVTPGEFRSLYEGVWQLGHDALLKAITTDTLDAALNTNQVVAKIWAGKAIAGMSDGGGSMRSVDVDETDFDSNDVKINVNIVRRKDNADE
ncbi:hypothetical protein DBA29_20340 [Xenophilus aerolatus]|nr:hypothetical protein [Xenophilus aerolatus]